MMGYEVSVSVCFEDADEYVRFIKLMEDNKKSGNLPTVEVYPEGRLVCQNQWSGAKRSLGTSVLGGEE
jgi:hypothetical protein